MADTVITTDRLVLRRFRDSDLSAWLAGMNTPEVRAHLGGSQSPEDCAERFARQKASWNEAEGGWLAIAPRPDGELIGNCGFARVAVEQAPDGLRGQIEIGWALRAESWGHGYATEAARGLLDLIFTRIRPETVFAQTSEANRASWRVMERLGMTRREDLDYHDPAYPPEENPTKVYSLARTDWTARPPGLRIESERLVLRPWREADFAALHALCTCPEVMATIGPLHDEEKTRGLLARLQQRQFDNGCTFWAMERKADGRVLGFCGASKGTVPQLENELEIGWRLAFDCWGQGHAREAAVATLGWIADNHPESEVWAITARSNTRSQGLMKRLGMRYREGMDFEHPAVAEGSPLRPHVTFWLERAPAKVAPATPAAREIRVHRD